MILDFIAPDGSGRLELDDRAVLDGQETVRNQNGILFLAYMARACGQSDVFWSAAIKHHCSVSVGRGRLLRRHGDPLRQSHDNLLGWEWFAVKYEEPEWAKDIYDFAKWRFFIYDPHKTYSLDPRCLLQGSHVFTLKLSAGIRPGWLATIWFCAGCVVADHSADYYLKSMLRSDIVRAKDWLLSKRKKQVVYWALLLMEKRRESLARWYKDYYVNCPEHPAVLAARANEYRGENE